MPNIKSAKKRVKVIETKTLQNKMFKSALKTDLKKYEAAVAAADHRKCLGQQGTVHFFMATNMNF